MDDCLIASCDFMIAFCIYYFYELNQGECIRRVKQVMHQSQTHHELHSTTEPLN